MNTHFSDDENKNIPTEDKNEDRHQSSYITENTTNRISYTPNPDGIYSYSVKETIPNEVSLKKRFALMFLVVLIGTALIMGGILIGFTLKAFNYNENYSSNYPSQGTVNIVDNRPAIETNPINYNDRALLTVPDIAASVSPSVVEIKTESAVYNQFYGSYVSKGAGSGVIITDTGFIITNHHVIEGASTVTVKLSNGNEYPATLVGTDAESDIAVISITPREALTPSYLGKSESLVLGESIVVIGNPLGSLGGSVTNGIISALDRAITIGGEEMTLIQTNAAVNPGNSGGGMFNMYGELVGIINAKSSGENIEGIGFAIPIDHAYSIASQLIEFGYVKGKVDHGFTLIEINDFLDMAKYGVRNTGVYIFASEYSDSFKKGDLIRSVNGVQISYISDIKTALKNCKIGDTVDISVYRNGKTFTEKLVLREYAPNEQGVN